MSDKNNEFDEYEKNGKSNEFDEYDEIKKTDEFDEYEELKLDEYGDIGKSNIIGDTIQNNNDFKQKIDEQLKNNINDKLSDMVLEQLEEDVDTRIYIDDEPTENANINVNKIKGYTQKPKKEAPKKTDKRVRTGKNYEEQNSNANFYVVTIFVSVLIFLLVSFIVFEFTIKSNKPKDTTVKDNVNIADNTDDELNIDDVEGYITSTALIENISNSGAIQLYDFEDNKTYNLKVTSDTQLLDNYEKPLVLGEFKAGDIVDYTHVKDKTSLEKLSISSNKKAFEVKKVTDINNVSEEELYIVGAKSYYYDEKTIVDFDRATYTPYDITKFDTVNMKGYDNNVYYIEVLKGHGDVKFETNPDIKNGIVEIDTTDTLKTETLTTITLSEGPHKIVVKGDNIDPYVTDILVEAGKTTDVSLLVAQSKKGLYVPTVTPSDSEIYIDGELINKSEPIMLEYGPHTVRVSKTGYEEFNDTILVKSEETRQNIALTAKVMMSKLKITTDPVGASIYVDNVLVGTSPVTQPIEYGNHTIIVKMDGYIQITYNLDVSTNENPLFFQLQKKDVVDTLPTVTTEPIVQ